jgi:Arc/MetJ-type ribon-helix-helix transcriptional regulator
MMNVALTDDLQRLLQRRIDNGEFPNDESVVEAALKRFLVSEPSQGHSQMTSATKSIKKAASGSFH